MGGLYLFQIYKFSLTEGRYVVNTYIGSVTVTDPDGDVDFTYRLIGRYADLFTIDYQV